MKTSKTITSIFFLLTILFAPALLSAQCTGWEVSPSSAIFYASGGYGSFDVTTTTGGCSYTVSASDTWIYDITTSGGTVNYYVAPNNSCDAQTGYIYIYDQYGNYQTYFTITEEGGCCTDWQVTPGYASFGAGGGTSTFDVTTSTGGCSYTPVASDPWINIISTNGGTVTYSVDLNATCNSETGYIYINDGDGNQQTYFEIDVDGNCCTNWEATPASAVFDANGGSNSFDVSTATGGCTYSASTDANWIVDITTNESVVSYTVLPNATCEAQTAVITVFDVNGSPQTTYVVEQTACTTGIKEVTLSSLSVQPNPSTGNFTVGFEMYTPGNVQIKIFDLFGQLVKEEQPQQVSGTYSHQMDISNLAKGIYILQINSDGVTQNRKIELQ